MAFQNAVVGGGGELVRDQIKSRNYVPGVSGWIIRRDGTSEFSGVTVRGDLYIGSPPSPPNAYIHGVVMAGVPTIAIYDGTHSNPARIQGFDLGGDGGMVLDSGDVAAVDTSLALGGNFGELFMDDVLTPASGLVHVGAPLNNAVMLRATGNGAKTLELGLDLVGATPDLIGGRIYASSEIRQNDGQADANYGMRVIDGKAPGTTTGTTIGATDTVVATANIQNTYLEAGYGYRCIYHIDHWMDALGTRLDYKLWKGTPATGTQLGGINRRWADFATNTLFGGTVLIFVWRQTVTETVANINLSALKGVNAGANATSQVNQAFMATIEKLGSANVIGGL